MFEFKPVVRNILEHCPRTEVPVEGILCACFDLEFEDVSML